MRVDFGVIQKGKGLISANQLRQVVFKIVVKLKCKIQDRRKIEMHLPGRQDHGARWRSIMAPGEKWNQIAGTPETI